MMPRYCTDEVTGRGVSRYAKIAFIGLKGRREKTMEVDFEREKEKLS